VAAVRKGLLLWTLPGRNTTSVCGSFSGVSSINLYNISEALVRHRTPQQSVGELQANLAKDLYATLAVPAMPIQDAIDLARFLVETTIGVVRFAVSCPNLSAAP